MRPEWCDLCKDHKYRVGWYTGHVENLVEICADARVGIYHSKYLFKHTSCSGCLRVEAITTLKVFSLLHKLRGGQYEHR